MLLMGGGSAEKVSGKHVRFGMKLKDFEISMTFLFDCMVPQQTKSLLELRTKFHLEPLTTL